MFLYLNLTLEQLNLELKLKNKNCKNVSIQLMYNTFFIIKLKDINAVRKKYRF